MVQVLLTVPFNEEFVARVQAAESACTVQIAPQELRRWLRSDGSQPLSPEAAGILAQTEVLIGWPNLSQAALKQAKRLRWIQTLSAGVDHLDPADYAHLTLTNASGVAAVAIAEYCIGMVLLFAKRLPQLMRLQQQHTWDRTVEGVEIFGKTCGIAGMGAIGGETARRAKALGMRVVATRRSAVHRPTDAFADVLLPQEQLDTLLEQSDYVVLTAPHTPETHHMIGAAQLARMKRSAVLINIGRGALVDEVALIGALREGVIAGAGLDVFEQEPLPATSPLWDLENVVITPHSSSGSEVYELRAAEVVCDNLRRFVRGEPLRNVVDLGRGY